MNIRKANFEDTIRAEEIYNEILDNEAKTVSYTNWKKGLYPTIKTARRAVEEGTFFVGEENGIIVGCVNLNSIQPNEYKNISWNFEAEDDKVLVIHTLCIPPSQSGKGYGKEFVKFAEEYGEKIGCTVIRLDTYEGNLPAINFYPRLGYTYAGVTEFFFEGFIRENLKCFDKKL
ncbi:MAG: GNAT family N-acetyltransferase [Eubacteriales bacterium]|nr:GNAT family N-acetyltransferase [Eubacteriales bacterium]